MSARRKTTAPARPGGAARVGGVGAHGAGAVDLAVRIGPLALSNPILTASGTFGYGDEYAHVVDLSRLGGVITKTVTLEPRPGNPPNRIAETAGAMLNSIGLENVGLERFVSEKLPRLAELEAHVVASIGGETPDELARILDRLGTMHGIAGFEVNFSCPNVAAGGARYWADPGRLERTMKRLRPFTRRALIAKLAPDVTSVPDLAIACEQGGADAVTAVNTFVGLAVDLAHMRSRLGRWTGGLSGPAIKPLALARCHETARAVSIPVIGSGGIMNGRDALEFIAVGANAVQVGTASFIRPRASLDVLEEMTAELTARGVRSIEDWRGCLSGPGEASANGHAGTPPGRGARPSRNVARKAASAAAPTKRPAARRDARGKAAAAGRARKGRG